MTGLTLEESRRAQQSPNEPRRVQESPGESRGAQTSPREPRRAQASPEEYRRAQESPDEPRDSPGEPRRAQESPGELRRALESLGEPRRAQASPDEPRRALRLQRFAGRCYDQVFAYTDRCSLCKKIPPQRHREAAGHPLGEAKMQQARIPAACAQKIKAPDVYIHSYKKKNAYTRAPEMPGTVPGRGQNDTRPGSPQPAHKI